MFSKATVIAFAAALGAVNASPLLRRQETGVTSLISSAVSSAVSSATEAVSGASSAASSAVSTATGAASSAVATATSDASSAVAGATSTGAAAPTTTEAVGTERYPAYPCAPGYLLTYAQVNQTLEGVPVTQAGQAAGEWATSPLFPNVTNATGGTEPGATHTISVMGISINEVLVNATANATSGYAQWTWNNTGGPVSAGPVTLDTYQTVFRVYDPDFTTTQEIGNTTFVQIFTNACANDQAAAAPLLETLGSLELGLLGAALSNATAPAATTAAEPASSAAETATSAVESASSAATSAVESATSAVESASSAATSAVESATSAVSSAASGAAASATSVASAATSAAAALTSTSA